MRRNEDVAARQHVTKNGENGSECFWFFERFFSISGVLGFWL